MNILELTIASRITLSVAFNTTTTAITAVTITAAAAANAALQSVLVILEME